MTSLVAIIEKKEIHPDGTVKYYRRNGNQGSWYLHNKGQAAVISKITGYRAYFQHGQYHNPNGPARLWKRKDKNNFNGFSVYRREYWLQGQKYENLEAHQRAWIKLQKTKVEVEHWPNVGPRDIRKYFRKNRKGEWELHRDGDLPAVEAFDGSLQKWFQNGNIHRDGDQPSLIDHKVGRQIWHREGKRHRENGPAYIAGLHVRYYLNGHCCDKNEYEKKIQNMKSVVDLCGTERHFRKTKAGEWILHRDDDKPAVIDKDNTVLIWYQDGQIHRDGDKPAYVSHGTIEGEYWYQDGARHRDGKPAYIQYKENQENNERWYQHGKLHNENGPAIVGETSFQRYWLNGQQYKTKEEYEKALDIFQNTKLKVNSSGTQRHYRKNDAGKWELHRDGDLPAVEFKNGTKQWYQHGSLHRDGDQPASVLYDDDLVGEYWFQDGKLHRDDGNPAYIAHGNNEKRWYQHDNLHNEHGPAIVNIYGSRYWLNGQEYLTKGKYEKALATSHHLHLKVDQCGTKRYYGKNKDNLWVLHRDGNLPAVEWCSGRQDWYQYGKCVKIVGSIQYERTEAELTEHQKCLKCLTEAEFKEQHQKVEAEPELTEYQKCLREQYQKVEALILKIPNSPGEWRSHKILATELCQILEEERQTFQKKTN